MYLINYKRTFYVAGMILCVACGNSKKQQQQAAMMGKMKPTVVAAEVVPAVYTVSEKFPATLMAHDIVQLKPDVSGYLEAIRVADGSNVTKGQPLYDIDRSRYAAAYGQVAATQQQAEAELAQRQRDYERYKSLLDHDAISKQTVDQAYTAMLTAQANVAAAKASVTRAGTDVSHAVVRAPVTGKIGIAQIKVGDVINAGQTLINTIVNEHPMFADMDIPQARLPEFLRIQKGQGGDEKFYIQFGDGTRYGETGKVLTINNIVDPQTGTVRVRLVFENKDNMLKSGMSIVIVMQYGTPATQLAIPAKAIIQNLSETSVYTISKDNVVGAQDIVPGPVTDTMQLVTSGLKAGDRIVVEGIQRVKPGDTVNIAGAGAGAKQ
ncbi:membrane fusion protein, multidrug efflux system [Chitinophaga ginsengisegetis]|uniref:Membrane fusion protein, multidrug efflux system n=1 Tax=Chitinophaga ginsengisegetis TaxID=393003 RepID=A0A1T5PAH1_9BACT|nr:efflux RND transporter periplasmic adaptor subunit [Chitinophaga ginsengisegetis]MDR6569883.1 membrane fusion protein (multidrug efflux system) [Chitinophaga ginsengisegetis]MDR6649616.1 membrane fusion protein (multidrug efflux system) [Chitinophaga ginsengisegetis]MDR6656181.1 membrane fusion protein (multidrug efflux system) [Chitinophaga ginsengisegetis]SKD09672.1 membrane fusion protein, multidrug efflux system [Chitinophaga ginsengisegetis]